MNVNNVETDISKYPKGDLIEIIYTLRYNLLKIRNENEALKEIIKNMNKGEK